MRTNAEAKQYKLKWWNTLFIKTYRNFAVVVLLFAVLLGLVYLRLYRDSNMENYRKQLSRKAKSIAARFHENIMNDDYEGCLSYLEVLRELEDEEVWTISNPNAIEPMNELMVSIDLSENELQPEYYEVIEGVFNRRTEYRSYYSDIHASTVVTVGVPILGKNKEVCGALLLITQLSSMDALLNSSKYLIVVSALIALLFAFIFAILFARQLSVPITKMRNTALELALGKYETKTGIDRKDEIGILAATIDFLTDKLLENEQERKNLEQMRLDFFANISHELRTPISVVRAYTESLVDGVVTDEVKVNQYYDRMLSECKSMERLVGDLLILSRMQNPDFVVEKEPVNLVQVFDDLLRSARTLAAEKNISIDICKDREVAMMMGDYDRLRQMFLVIIDNAVKFSNEASKIQIILFQDDKLHIKIKDQGIGISEEELPNIFDKFYKSKLRQNAKGTGLGLAIAKQISLKHGGKIYIKSKTGVGTEFHFLFDYVLEKDLENIL